MAQRTRKRGQLEEEVLSAVTAAGHPVAAKEVREALGGELAYTTVLTVLVRLHAKGLVEREPSGRAYLYRLAGKPKKKA